MQPLTPGIAGFGGADREHLGCDAGAAVCARNDRVQNKCVNRAVPGHIDESNQGAALHCAPPSEAVSIYLGPPVIVQYAMTECLGVQAIHLLVGEFSPPGV